MAAQAVDFTISGHINRALFVVDSDDPDSSKAEIANNGSSSTRVRVTGSGEMMDGNTVGIQFEYEEGGSFDKGKEPYDDGGGGTGLKLRHANVYYSGEFGKITIGQGSEAGDASAYRGGVGTFGIGHGQGTGSAFTLGSYFGSLDAGGRKNAVRYDTPALGPVGAAVSVANGDSISLAATLSTEFSGSSFNAMVASLREDSEVEGKAQETIGASFGVSMASGLGISGAWARGDNHGSTAEKDGKMVAGCYQTSAQDSIMAGDLVAPDETGHTFAGVTGCPSTAPMGYKMSADTPAGMGTDPSYFQAAIGYNVRQHHRRGELVQFRGLREQGLGGNRDRHRREPQPSQGRGAGVRGRAELRRRGQGGDEGREARSHRQGRVGVRGRNARHVLVGLDNSNLLRPSPSPGEGLFLFGPLTRAGRRPRRAVRP